MLTIEDLRPVARWAADCAERALPIFEAKAAHAAAREVGDPAAAASARAASVAAAVAYTHPIATPHQVNHILGPAAYAAQAIALRAGEADAGETEIRRAIALAPTEVRQVMQGMPERAPGKRKLGALFLQLEMGQLEMGVRRA